ncbi:hypothetical protein ACFX2I_019810 [Malus domestica]
MEGMVLVYGPLCEGQDEEKDDAKRPKNLTYYRIHDLPENLCHSSDHQVRGNAEKKRLLKRCPYQDFPVYPNLQVQGDKMVVLTAYFVGRNESMREEGHFVYHLSYH